MEDRVIRKGQTWRHFKGFIVHIIEPSVFDTESGEELVVYLEESKQKVWARPKSMFLEEVDHVKYPEVPEEYRFTKISEPEEGDTYGSN